MKILKSLWTLPIAAALMGCGGGGGGISGTVISGRATAPGTSGAGKTRAESVPIANGVVTVHDLTTGVDLPPATTNANGDYQVGGVTEGDNYVVRVYLPDRDMQHPRPK